MDKEKIKRNRMSKMSKFKIFLIWFFQRRGSTKIHPLHTLTPTQRIGLTYFSSLARKMNKKYKTRKCVICNCTFYSTAKKPSPVCTTWDCFRDYYYLGGKNDKTYKVKSKASRELVS